MKKIEKLEIQDETGVFKNINDFLADFREGNIEGVALIYTRKDESIRVFWNEIDSFFLVGLLEQLKFDALAAVHDDAVVTTFG